MTSLSDGTHIPRVGATLPSVWICLLFTGCYWISDAERDARWDLDGDGVERPLDCDDDNAELFDNRVFFRDADGDGYGDINDATEACAPPEGYVADSTDCNDSASAVNPGADEVCNGVDDDCDLSVDEDTALVRFYRDADGDGAGDLDDVVEACVRPEGYVAVGDDCDDDDEDIYPGADEVCNGIDDDCDGDVDLDDSGIDPTLITWYLDDDGDDFGRDDRTEISCDQPEGYVSAPGDCDDDDEDVNPDADERCNGYDDDCDVDVDEDAIDALRSYPDDDGDGFGDPDFPVDSCIEPAGHVANGGDCDDDAPQSNPLADEWCDTGEDEDCDGDVDESACVPPPTGGTGDTSVTGDTGSSDTGSSDTGSSDTGSSDTSDTGPTPTGQTGDTGGGS